MYPLNLDEIKTYVNSNIVYFHENRLKTLKGINLKKILKKKNPYLFKAKNITVASDFVMNILDAFLSSSEEKLFGDFLEDLVIFISNRTCNGKKSSTTGIDLEFENKGVHYLISIKSGPNWGNNAQQTKQEEYFKTAVKVLKQSKHTKNVQPVLGIYYGKTRPSIVRSALKLVGQNFWYFISENEELYTDIIEPLGYKAKKHNDNFIREKNKIVNIFTQEFLQEFCKNGSINWGKIVEFNSGNYNPNFFK